MKKNKLTQEELNEILKNATKHDLLGKYWKHIKTGGCYFSTALQFDTNTMDIGVRYRQVNGVIAFSRPLNEFIDGRFEEMTDRDEIRKHINES